MSRHPRLAFFCAKPGRGAARKAACTKGNGRSISEEATGKASAGSLRAPLRRRMTAMQCRCLLALLSSGLLLLGSNAAEPDDLSEKEQTLVRGLEKQLAAVRGLAFKSAVAVRRSAESKDSKVAAVSYDFAAKTLVVAGAPSDCERGEL